MLLSNHGLAHKHYILRNSKCNCYLNYQRKFFLPYSVETSLPGDACVLGEDHCVI